MDVILQKEGNEPLLELHHLAIYQNRPLLCGFIETYYLNEQVKSIKNRVTTVTNLSKTGALEPGIAELIFDKHILGESDNNR